MCEIVLCVFISGSKKLICTAKQKWLEALLLCVWCIAVFLLKCHIYRTARNTFFVMYKRDNPGFCCDVETQTRGDLCGSEDVVSQRTGQRVWAGNVWSAFIISSHFLVTRKKERADFIFKVIKLAKWSIEKQSGKILISEKDCHSLFLSHSSHCTLYGLVQGLEVSCSEQLQTSHRTP